MIGKPVFTHAFNGHLPNLIITFTANTILYEVSNMDHKFSKI